jgi:hypothetical protein
MRQEDSSATPAASQVSINHRRLNPVFVVGHGRSGTSILADLLRKHLRLAFGTESQFFIRYYRQLHRYGDLRDERNRRLLLEDLSRERFFQRSLKYGVRLDVERAVREAEPTYAGVLTAIMRQSAECQRMERWGDKTPEYTRHLFVVRELFPSAQFIHIVRDGRDVALSGFRMHFGAKNSYAAAREWGHVLSEVQAFKKTAAEGTFIELRYEDLLTRTQETFAQILRFLDIDDTGGEVSRAVGRLAGAELRAGNFFKWKTELSARDQEVFAAVAGSWLSEYGYEVPATTRSAPGRAASWYWQCDNVVRRMMMRAYWADTLYKVGLKVRAQRVPLRALWSPGRVER